MITDKIIAKINANHFLLLNDLNLLKVSWPNNVTIINTNGINNIFKNSKAQVVPLWGNGFQMKFTTFD